MIFAETPWIFFPNSADCPSPKDWSGDGRFRRGIHDINLEILIFSPYPRHQTIAHDLGVITVAG